ncbi:MAG: LytTR family DNA-binding domain-containing protein [Prevotellaceae bacterium]|jgi:DNA-binding LytR/AlgR family response regulator|nr:LytTR family DNA-binding domain-containing protein [Prevotellaceae bacterium]
MNVLIVEDETAAYENLLDIIAETDPSITVVGNTESISQTVQWLQTNPAPDLILMDIHLSDGSAFSIFECVTVETPIIFTTAYDHYAIDAFKQNSVDYLLKPIKADELKRALTKFSKWARADVLQYLHRITQLSAAPRYKERLLLPVKDKLLPLSLSDIAYFYTTDKRTCLCLKSGVTYPYTHSLDQISLSLNPMYFFRANKQFIIARNSIQNITVWFDSRLLVTLNVETPERIYVSKNKAAEFKEWVVEA